MTSQEARRRPKEHPHEVRDPAIHQRRAERLKQIAAQDAQNLTIAQRLTKRALERELEIPMTDSAGEFFIKLHIPTRDEFDQILALMPLIGNKAAPKEALKAVDEFYRLLEVLCVDKSLNYEFWKEGAYDTTDFFAVLMKLMEDLTKLRGEAQSFRPK
jgi:hypothetical protein